VKIELYRQNGMLAVKQWIVIDGIVKYFSYNYAPWIACTVRNYKMGEEFLYSQPEDIKSFSSIGKVKDLTEGELMLELL